MTAESRIILGNSTGDKHITIPQADFDIYATYTVMEDQEHLHVRICSVKLQNDGGIALPLFDISPKLFKIIRDHITAQHAIKPAPEGDKTMSTFTDEDLRAYAAATDTKIAPENEGAVFGKVRSILDGNFAANIVERLKAHGIRPNPTAVVGVLLKHLATGMSVDEVILDIDEIVKTKDSSVTVVAAIKIPCNGVQGRDEIYDWLKTTVDQNMQSGSYLTLQNVETLIVEKSGEVLPIMLSSDREAISKISFVLINAFSNTEDAEVEVIGH